VKSNIEKRAFFIDIAKCTNCGACSMICKLNAIAKNENYDCSKCIKYCLTLPVICDQKHYYIIENQCNGCGDCVFVCKENAIFVPNSI